MFEAGDDVWFPADDFGEVGLEGIWFVAVVDGVLLGGEGLLDLEEFVGFGVVQQPDHSSSQL